MRVLIEGADGAVLDVGPGDGVLLPLDDNERAEAFEALTGALALLAGVRRPDAREGERVQCSPATEQSDDPRRRGVVVPLR